MASRDKKDLDLKLSKAVTEAFDKYKQLYPNAPQPLISCTYRSIDEQNKLYEIGRTIAGRKVTNAKGGQSKHNTYPSQAFDIAFITLDKKLDWNEIYFKKFAEIICENSFIQWGGDWKTFKDTPHFELKSKL